MNKTLTLFDFLCRYFKCTPDKLEESMRAYDQNDLHILVTGLFESPIRVLQLPYWNTHYGRIQYDAKEADVSEHSAHSPCYPNLCLQLAGVPRTPHDFPFVPIAYSMPLECIKLVNFEFC